MAKEQDKQEVALTIFRDDVVEPFEVDYQNRFLNVFISDKEGFTERIIDIVQVEFFESYQKIILDYELNFFNKYREIARFDTLKDIINQKEKGLNKEHLIGLIEKIEKLEIQNIKHIKDTSHHFFKDRSMRNCIFELAIDAKKHNYDSMKVKLENAMKAGEPKDAGHNYLKDAMKRLKADYRNPISFLPSLDQYIGGGLAPGESGFILAPMGGGKSMMLVAGASTALLCGKKVIYYTLELSEEIVGQRFDACINKLLLKGVWEFPDIIIEKLEEIEKIGGSLIIKKFSTGEASVNTLMSHIRNLETNEGFIPDIIFIDYADLMKPLDNYSEKRHSLDGIYISIRGMADELKIPCWSALQGNRESISVEKISLKNIGETLGAGKTADVIISLGKDPEEAEENPTLAKIGILKNRNGQAGFYLDATFDSSKVFIEIKPIDPSGIMMKKKKNQDKNTNSNNKKSDSSTKDDEEDLFVGY